MSKQVRVGDTVLWLPKGRLDVDPWPATVLRIDSQSMLTLNVCNPENGTFQYIRNVWPRDSVQLKNSPLLVQTHGAWQFMPPAEVPEKPPVVQKNPNLAPPFKKETKKEEATT